jgi:hypothetical protein
MSQCTVETTTTTISSISTSVAFQHQQHSNISSIPTSAAFQHQQQKQQQEL